MAGTMDKVKGSVKDAIGREWHGRRDFGPHDVLILQQTLAVGRQQLRQQYREIRVSRTVRKAAPRSSSQRSRPVPSRSFSYVLLLR